MRPLSIYHNDALMIGCAINATYAHSMHNTQADKDDDLQNH